MVGLFKQKTPINIFFVFILGILIKIPIFISVKLPVVDTQSSEFFKKIEALLNNLIGGNAIVYSIITFLLLFSQSLQLNIFLDRGRLMQKPSYLPAAAYLIFSSFIPEWNYFSAPLLVNSILLFIFIQLSRVIDLKISKTSFFNIGFATGICVFLYFPTCVLFIWLILSLFLIRSIRANLLLLSVVGLLTPFYFYGTYLFLNDQLSLQLLLPSLQLSKLYFSFTVWSKVGSLIIVGSSLIGAYLVNTGFRQMLVPIRVKWNSLILFLLFAIVMLFLSNTINYRPQVWMIFLIPASTFISVAFLSNFGLLSKCIFWISILFVVCFQLFGSGW